MAQKDPFVWWVLLRFFVSFFFPLVSEMNHPLVTLFLQANCVLTHVV